MVPWSLDTVQDNGHGIGLWGALIVVGLIVVSVGLFFFMRRSLGRINFSEDQQPEDRPQP